MSQTLRIATPTEAPGGLDAPRSGHFGHAASFTIVDLEDGKIAGTSVVANPPHEHGGCGLVVQQLAREGVAAVIVAGMGNGPRSAMAANGMQALHDPVSATPREAVAAYLGGALPLFGGEHACRGH